MVRCLVAITFAAVTLAGSSASADPSPFEKSYETDKKIGVGVMLGVPAGATAKFLATPLIGFDIGVGAYVAYRDRTGTAGHADVLIHPFVAVEGNSFLAPLYFGVGARVLDYDGTTHIGVRVPVGISFDFTGSHFETFLEGAVIYDPSISSDAMTEDVSEIDANFLVGGRYFL